MTQARGVLAGALGLLYNMPSHTDPCRAFLQLKQQEPLARLDSPLYTGSGGAFSQALTLRKE